MRTRPLLSLLALSSLLACGGSGSSEAPQVCLKNGELPEEGSVSGILESYRYVGDTANMYIYNVRQPIADCEPVSIHQEGSHIATASGYKVGGAVIGKPIKIKWSKEEVKNRLGTVQQVTKHLAALPEGEPKLDPTIVALADCKKLYGPDELSREYTLTGLLQKVDKVEELTRIDGTKYRPQYIAHKYSIYQLQDCPGDEPQVEGYSFGPMPLVGGGELLETHIGKIVQIRVKQDEMDRSVEAKVLN